MTLRNTMTMLLGVLAVAGAPMGSPSRAEGALLATLQMPTPVAGLGTDAAWSELVGNRYALRLLRAGRVIDPGVATRSVPFDVNLGVRHGRVWAVYSRCAHEPIFRFGPQPEWTTARGCSIEGLPLAGTHERTLLSSSAGAGVLPA